jgi:hypothetical protein
MARGTFTVRVTTDEACTWTAVSDAPWLTVTRGRSGSGSGTISIAYTDNYVAPRHGVVEVRWPAASLGQNVHVAQAGCHYAVTRSSIDVPATGGTASFDVLQQADPMTCGGALQDRCVWSARADVSWITITSSMPRSGDQPVAFRASANTTTSARSGRITVRDTVVTVTQPAP